MVIAARVAVGDPSSFAGEFAFRIEQSRHREAYEKALRRMLERCTCSTSIWRTAQHYDGDPARTEERWQAPFRRTTCGLPRLAGSTRCTS